MESAGRHEAPADLDQENERKEREQGLLTLALLTLRIFFTGVEGCPVHWRRLSRIPDLPQPASRSISHQAATTPDVSRCCHMSLWDEGEAKSAPLRTNRVVVVVCVQSDP